MFILPSLFCGIVACIVVVSMPFDCFIYFFPLFLSLSHSSFSLNLFYSPLSMPAISHRNARIIFYKLELHASVIIFYNCSQHNSKFDDSNRAETFLPSNCWIGLMATPTINAMTGKIENTRTKCYRFMHMISIWPKWEGKRKRARLRRRRTGLGVCVWVALFSHSFTSRSWSLGSLLCLLLL